MKKKISVAALFILTIFFYNCSKNEPTIPLEEFLQPISEIDLSTFLSEPSGISYRTKSNTLFVVSDTLKNIYEIDLTGNLLKSIAVAGKDFEGITFSLTEDTIFVVEESDNQVTSYTLNGTKIKSFTKNVSTLPGNGLEGLTFDNAGVLYLINESSPRYFLKLINETEIFRKEIIASDDLSDVCFDKTNDCLWIVSDESKKLLKLSKEGVIQSEWNLPFDKCEGITFIEDKMYLVKDDNSSLYVFAKPK